MLIFCVSVILGWIEAVISALPGLADVRVNFASPLSLVTALCGVMVPSEEVTTTDLFSRGLSFTLLTNILISLVFSPSAVISLIGQAMIFDLVGSGSVSSFARVNWVIGSLNTRSAENTEKVSRKITMSPASFLSIGFVK